jgi:hypothetical protein
MDRLAGRRLLHGDPLSGALSTSRRQTLHRTGGDHERPPKQAVFHGAQLGASVALALIDVARAIELDEGVAMAIPLVDPRSRH